MWRRQLEQHKQGLAHVQQDHTEAARRQKEIDAQARHLGGHLDKARANAERADTTTAKHSDSERLCSPSPHSQPPCLAAVCCEQVLDRWPRRSSFLTVRCCPDLLQLTL